jgi:hypothetical protein
MRKRLLVLCDRIDALMNRLLVQALVVAAVLSALAWYVISRGGVACAAKAYPWLVGLIKCGPGY